MALGHPNSSCGGIAHVCDCCNAEWWGASKRDLLDDGWKFHDAKRGRVFVMCGECERRFDQRRGALRLDPAP